jgi:hypothetical protein
MNVKQFLSTIKNFLETCQDNLLEDKHSEFIKIYNVYLNAYLM